jgi:TIR domain-containing protein
MVMPLTTTILAQAVLAKPIEAAVDVAVDVSRKTLKLAGSWAFKQFQDRRAKKIGLLPGEVYRSDDPRRTSIFICYRRDDTADTAGRLYDALTASFTRERVFLDIDTVPLGVSFVSFVEDRIRRSRVGLVLIGQQWLTARDVEGGRRLDSRSDHVRTEVATMLRQRIPLIPVLVKNAAMPRPVDLPEDIRDVAFYNGLKLSPEFWREGVERLIKELDRVMKG